MSLRYPVEWKFAVSDDADGVPPRLVNAIHEQIVKIASAAKERQDIIEAFKDEFASASGTTIGWSSSYDWAISDLSTAMETASKNPATFVDAYWSGLEFAQKKNLPCPSVEIVNKLLVSYDFPFEIRPPDLLKRLPQQPGVLANIVGTTAATQVEEQSKNFRQHLQKRGFDLGTEIGSGLSGTVYRANQVSLNRDVAIKCFDNPISAKNIKLRQRFLHEAKLLAVVQHPSVPFVITTGSWADMPYIIMQYIQGQSMRQWLLTKGILDVRSGCRAARTILLALARAHSAQVVHRDVKPENILTGVDGTTYLIDFSIGASLESLPGLTRVTGGDNIPGTPDYMAPEVLEGQPWDHRIDIYATGACLAEFLSGRRFSRATLESDLRSVNGEVANVIRTACALDPKARFPSAEVFADALDVFAQRTTPTSGPQSAICANIDCSAASWTKGFQPQYFRETTDSHCRACGKALEFPCKVCARVYDGSGQFCPGCGKEIYQVPACEQCGSPLSAQDRHKDTTFSGCGRCDIPF